MHFLSPPWVGAFALTALAGVAGEPGLAGHWRLDQDCTDASGQGRHGRNHGVTFSPGEGAAFSGTDAWIEVPAALAPALGRSDWSLAVWLHTEAVLDDVPGDLVSQFDPAVRRGFNLSLLNCVGGTTAQANWRNLFFGIDGGRTEPRWVDCGRPGNNRMVWALAVHDGSLYAGTWEPGEGEAGHVHRYDGGTQWTDCGAPNRCNAVSALAQFEGKLYAGTSLYTGEGSALPPSPNRHPGGRVFRYEGGTQWTDCGRIGDVWTVTGLAEYRGQLYATTCDSYGCPNRTAAVYVYEGGQAWRWVGDPGGRAAAFIVHDGSLYATTFGKEGFARYEGGTQWLPLGVLPGVSQNYSAVVHRDRICMGTWPNGEVFRFDGPGAFTSLGRLGNEKEVMAMAVYNGRLYGGTLPLGEVYRYDEGTAWTRTGQLDTTPEVTYRRVWSMAVYQGRLFAGTLPSGRVCSLLAGACTTHDRALPAGWRHVAAVKAAGRLQLFVDGAAVAESAPFNPDEFDLAGNLPLRIGRGETAGFRGRLCDLRLYNRALTAEEIQGLGRAR